MLDGLWTVEFEGVPNFLGGGVVVLTNNRLYGGDSQYYYTGLYDVKERNLSALVQICSFVPGAVTIFGTGEKQFTLNIDGMIREDTINAVGTRVENPLIRLPLTLRKRSGFP